MCDSIVFYRSFHEAIKGLDAEVQVEIYNALFNYGFDGIENELSPIAKAVFTLIKPQIDANARRREQGIINGKKGAEYGKLGGRPKKNNGEKPPKKPLKNPSETDKNPLMINVNVNDNVNDINNTYSSIPYAEIIDYLNKVCKTAYRASSRKTKGFIKARFEEGFSVDDFKKVIDNKAAEWLNNPDMCKYLRPETLFGNKFEGYLNQKKAIAKGGIEIDSGFRDFLGQNEVVDFGI